jgi:hypothetical protein
MPVTCRVVSAEPWYDTHAAMLEVMKLSGSNCVKGWDFGLLSGFYITWYLS